MKTPMGAIVRRAKIEDAEGIAELSGQLGYPATTDESAERLAEIDANEEHRVLVAEDKGRLLGWVHVCLPHSLLRDRQAEVVGLVIEEKHKGRGIGRALMKHAEHWAKEMGCNSVRLRSNAARQDAHAFYERLGYEVNKSQKVFCKALGGRRVE